MSNMRPETIVRKARERMQAFDPRGSLCPICKAPFRTGCSHSVAQAEERLQRDYIAAVARSAVRRSENSEKP